MSTSEQENLESADGEELVAYLDGELPPEESRRVEERLAADDDYREQLRELDQAWEALNALPRTNVGDDFARTTIEMVAVEAAGDLAKRTAQATKSYRTRQLRWAAVAVIAGAVGFAAASVLLPSGDKQLLEDLPAIRQVDLLTQVSDIEFLRELSKRVPVEQLTRDQKALKADVEAIDKSSAPTKEQREAWVRELTAAEKQDLHTQKNRFLEYSDKERQRMRDLSKEIAAAKDAENLRETLVAYGQWLANKRPNIKFELSNRELSINARLLRIAEQLKEEGRRLSEEEKRKLRNEIRTITQEHKDAMFAAAAQREPDIEPIRKRVEAQAVALELCTVMWALNNTNEEIRVQTRKRLVDQLDEDSRDDLSVREGQRGQGPPRDQLVLWIFGQVLPSRRNHDPQELMRFFAGEELNNETRRFLAELPLPVMEEELAMRYDAQKTVNPRDFEAMAGVPWPLGRGGRGFGGFGGQRGGGRGRRGPGEGGPPFGQEGEFMPERGRGRGNRGGRDNRGDERFIDGPRRGERGDFPELPEEMRGGRRGPMRGEPGGPPPEERQQLPPDRSDSPK